MTATPTMNGKPPRKQLGDQLDRLDSILGALAEGLPGAVAEACREGARLAVRDAIIEIVTNPELRALLAPVRSDCDSTVPAPEPNKPSLWSRLRARIAAARDGLVRVASKVKSFVVAQYRAVRAAVTARYTTARAVVAAAGKGLPWRRFLVRAAVVGLVVGLVCLVAPQTVAAVVSAGSVATTALAVQTVGWLRRAARRFGLVR